MLDPLNAELVSSKGVRPERIAGAYSVSRKTRSGNSEGFSILYACPGQTGHARLMMLDVIDGGFSHMLRAAIFIEKVCKQEPKGSGSDAELAGIVLKKQATESNKASASKSPDEPVSDDNSVSASMVNDAQLKKLNQALPTANRPVDATVVLKTTRSGFPPVRNRTAHMVLEFPDGTELACSNWSPAGEFPSKESRQSRSCKFPELVQ